MVEFNIYVMFKLCKLFFNLIRSYMIIINHTFKIMFHIYLIMKVGNFIYYNIKELVAIRLISIRN